MSSSFGLILSLFKFLEINQKRSHFIIFSSLLIIISFIYFAFIATISYNAVSTFASCLWAIGFILHYSINFKQGFFNNVSLVIIGIAILFAFTGRPPFGIVLFFSTPILIVALNKLLNISLWENVLRHILINSLFILIYILSNYEVINNITTLYTSQMQTSHTNLIGNYIRETFIFLSNYLPILMLVLFWMSLLKYLDRKELKSILALVFTLGVVGIMYFIVIHIIDYNKTNLIISNLAIFFSLSIAYLLHIIYQHYTRTKQLLFLKKRALVTLVSFFPSFISGLGTNGNIFSHAGYSMVLLALPFCVILWDLTHRLEKYRFFVFLCTLFYFATIFYTVLNEQYIDYRRNESHAFQKYYSRKSPFLKSLSIEKEIANNIDSLITVTEKIGFDKILDKVFAYPDLPGFIAATGLKSFGNVWTFTGYPNIDANNCEYINLEPITKTRYIYILKGNELSPNLQKCLFAKIKPSRQLKEYDIGEEAYHYRNHKNYKLKLIGPYLLK